MNVVQFLNIFLDESDEIDILLLVAEGSFLGTR